MRLSAKILGILFSILILLSIPKAAFAQNNPSQAGQQPQYLNPQTSTNVPSNLHTWTQSVMIEVLSSMVCQLTGIDPVNKNQPCLGADSKTGKIGYAQENKGLIGFATNMIGYTYVIPVHTGDYFAMVSQNFGIAKSSYAANIDGFQALTYIQGAWIVFRNLAYILFVLVFVVIGVAIMLRVRIDPRTVMTIQNQIPKLIVGVVLVTFSFAIAGFLIDLMWLLIYFMINTLAAADPNLDAGQITSLLNSPAPHFANNQAIAPSGGLPGVVANVGGTIGGLVANLFNAGPQPGGSVLDILTNPLGAVIGFIFGAIAGLLAIFIVAVAILYALIRLWLALIKAYISILVDVIFAPFWIIAGLIPQAGPSVGMGAWIRDIIANLAVFPTVITMILLAKVLVDSLSNGFDADSSFIPPLIGGNNIDANGLGALITLGILLATPGIADTIKKALKTSGPGLGGVGGAIGVGQGVVFAPIGRTWHTLTKRGNITTGEERGQLRRAWEGQIKPGGALGFLKRRVVGDPNRPTAPKSNAEIPKKNLSQQLNEDSTYGNSGGEKKT